MSTHGICRTLRTRWARPTPGLAEPRLLCAVCVRGCARVRQGWLGSFMQFGYRIISDMSHISLLLFKRGQSSGLRCDCSRPTQQAKTNAKLAVQGLGVIATVPWSVLFLQGGMKEILESPTRIVLRNSSAPGQPGALLCAGGLQGSARLIIKLDIPSRNFRRTCSASAGSAASLKALFIKRIHRSRAA
jgi:hypothetical protein